jgi:glycosyltransferase involved in cell wall biosynthesis
MHGPLSSKRKFSLGIDARLIGQSGIGTVIANLLGAFVDARDDWQFTVAGECEQLSAFSWSRRAHVALVPFHAPIYSVEEQRTFPISAFAGTDLMWSPHYNVPLRWRRRLLVTVHDVAHLALPEFRRSLAKRCYARTMFEVVRRRADLTVFVSEFSRGEFARRVGPMRRSAAVVPNGVALAWFQSDGAPPPRPGPYIIYVGNVKPHKNLVRLLEAFEALRGEVPHDLLIVGQADGFITPDPVVKERAARMGGRVVLTGRVDQSKVRSLVRHADALVLPSLYEGFGLTALEAMAAGCPVVAARAAALPEVCGDAVQYCDPLDVGDIAAAIRRVLSDEPLRRGLIDRGRARARRYDWDRSASAYLDAMARLCDDVAG